jgi:hypothetical protein
VRCQSAGVRWAEDFLFAGSSALMLLVAGYWPELWPLSLLALVPFLHRVVRANPRQALRLGFLLGLSYFAVHLASSASAVPFASTAQIVIGTALCAAFGWAVARASQRWGFNPAAIALLWLALEAVLMRAGFVTGILTELNAGSSLLVRASVLFGFLAVSFVVVFINAVIVLAIDSAIEAASARGTVYPESKRTWDPFLVLGLAAQRQYLTPSNRAPPRAACRPL